MLGIVAHFGQNVKLLSVIGYQLKRAKFQSVLKSVKCLKLKKTSNFPTLEHLQTFFTDDR